MAARALAEVALITPHAWDALGAKRAGMLTGWVSRKEQIPPSDPKPDLQAATLAGGAKRILAAR